MKRILIAAMMCALAAPAAAQLYKWVDKDGKTHYSDTPPPNQDTKQLKASSGATTETPAPPKSAVARDKELEKGRQESREAAKKSDDAARLAASRDEQCQRMRNQYQQLVDGGRIHKYNDKGERIILDDAQLEKEREKTRADMEDACKKS
jgi:biotin carboxylase